MDFLYLGAIKRFYLRERERKQNRNTISDHKKRKWKVHMYEKCMNMWHEILRASWVKPSPNQTTLTSIINHTYNKCINIVIMLMECNAWSYSNNIITSNPKISRETQKPQKFWKTPKLRSKCMKSMKRKRIRTLTKCLEQDLGR